MTFLFFLFLLLIGGVHFLSTKQHQQQMKYIRVDTSIILIGTLHRQLAT